MKLQFSDDFVPGTKLKKSETEYLTGLAFLKKVFFVSEGVMLTQIRDISGIDGSTLQNWTKRGWVENSKLKKYDINQVAHILIINMLRSCMQLDKIAYIIQYINGRVDDRSDDIIADSVLYDYICRILDALTEKVNAIDSIKDTVKELTSDYEDKIEGARERLDSALEIIVIAYYASLVKRHADELLTQI